MSQEIYKIIGLRETDEMNKEFNEYLKSGSPESEQIVNGYTNPLVVANIVRCRVKCLIDRR